MPRLRKKVVVLGLLLAVVLGLFARPVAAEVPTVKIDQEPMYATFVKVLSYVRQYYVEDISLDKLLTGAIKGALGALDPYSTYFAKQDFQGFLDTTISGTFVGIGVVIEQKNNGIVIVSPIKGSPADLAGLKAGDMIIEVDGTNLKDVAVDDVSKLIRGQAGTTVKIKVRKVAGDMLEIPIVRATIKMETVESDIIDNNQVGIIRLSRFTESTAADLGAAFQDLKSRGAKGYVIDLRDNPGGLLTSAIDVLRYLQPKGAAVNIVARDGRVNTIDSGTDQTIPPLVMLINGGSASASEIVAGSVRDYGTAYIMGAKSYGKGSVQQIFDLGDGDGMKVTIARYMTPYKNKIDGIGVTPDELVPEDWDEPAKAPPYVLSKDFKTGDTGTAVDSLERSLVALGYLKSASGKYGPALVEAIQKFQKGQSLSLTGSVNTETATRINHELAVLGKGGMDRQTWEAVQMLKMKYRIGW
jgi:carboxyl-terminal processing protease